MFFNFKDLGESYPSHVILFKTRVMLINGYSIKAGSK